MELTKKTRDTILLIGKLNNRNKKPNCRKVSKHIDITYCHVNKVVKILQENNYLIKIKKGRDTFLLLTEEGKKAYHALEILKEVGLE